MHMAVKGLIEAGMTSDRAIRSLSRLMFDAKGKPRNYFVPESNRLKRPEKKGERWTLLGERALSRRTFQTVKEDLKKLAGLGILFEERHGAYRRYEINDSWLDAIRAYVKMRNYEINESRKDW
jgi:hypothetical protein